MLEAVARAIEDPRSGSEHTRVLREVPLRNDSAEGEAAGRSGA